MMNAEFALQSREYTWDVNFQLTLMSVSGLKLVDFNLTLFQG